VAATATTSTALAASPRWVKVTLNSGTGSVTMTATQHSMAPL
jgi:hypothetical protein